MKRPEMADGRRKQLERGIKIYIFLVLLAMAWMLEAGASMVHAAMLQRGISRGVLRFHVLANSDGEVDQLVKLDVRDDVLAWLEQRLSEEEQSDLGRMKDRIASLLPQIKAIAEHALEKNGAHYPAEVWLAKEYFPEKSYGNCTFPAGNYLALKISLGEAKGHNWWCVLFPRLCFLDCVHAVMPQESQEQLRGILTEEEYESLFDPAKDPYVIRFRYF